MAGEQIHTKADVENALRLHKGAQEAPQRDNDGVEDLEDGSDD